MRWKDEGIDAMTRLVSILAVAIAFAGMAAWIWSGVPDPIIDFGREVYVAWRISQGERLYAHLSYINGPLSPHLNALLFKIVEPSLEAVKWFNLAQAAVLTAMLFAMLRRVGGDLAGLLGGIGWCVLFCFGYYSIDPTFNFLTPYAQDLTHGLILGVAALVCMDRAIRSRSRRWLAFAGTFAGLALLTKPEPILATLAMLGVSLAISWRQWKRGDYAVLAVAMILPVALAWLLLSAAIGPGPAADGMLGGFRWVLETRLTSMPLYQDHTGLADKPRNALKMLMWFGIYAAAVAVMAGVALSVRAVEARGRTIIGLAAGLVFASLLVLGDRHILWSALFRGVPLAVLLIGVLAWRGWELDRDRRTILLLWAAFALVLLLKTIYQVRIVYIGFALAAPATLLCIAALCEWAKRLGAGSGAFRIQVAMVWLAIVAAHAYRVHLFRGALSVPIHPPADAVFFTNRARGAVIDEALKELPSLIAPQQTLACIPDGAMFNFLARRVNPAGHSVIVPGELVMFGEEKITADYQRAAPDFILLVHEDNSLHGAKFFGRDYARPLAAWIRENYEPVRKYGALPFTSDEFGLLLLKRRAD